MILQESCCKPSANCKQFGNTALYLQWKMSLSLFPICNLGESVPGVASNSCSWRAGAEPYVVFRCHSTFTSRFGLVYPPRCFSAYRGCFWVTIIFLSAWTGLTRLLCSLSSIFKVFPLAKPPFTILYKLYKLKRDCCMSKSQERSSFWNTQTSRSGSNRQQSLFGSVGV